MVLTYSHSLAPPGRPFPLALLRTSQDKQRRLRDTHAGGDGGGASGKIPFPFFLSRLPRLFPRQLLFFPVSFLFGGKKHSHLKGWWATRFPRLTRLPRRHHFLHRLSNDAGSLGEEA